MWGRREETEKIVSNLSSHSSTNENDCANRGSSNPTTPAQESFTSHNANWSSYYNSTNKKTSISQTPTPPPNYQPYHWQRTQLLLNGIPGDTLHWHLALNWRYMGVQVLDCNLNPSYSLMNSLREVSPLLCIVVQIILSPPLNFFFAQTWQLGWYYQNGWYYLTLVFISWWIQIKKTHHGINMIRVPPQIWPLVDKITINRSKVEGDGVVKELSDRIWRNAMNEHI